MINAYTLQAKILSRKLEAVDPDSVLAIQVIGFRDDWGDAWTRLESHPDLFVSEVNKELENGHRVVWVRGNALPATLVDYLKGPANSLLDNDDLAAYVSTAQVGLGSDPAIVLAQVIVDDLLRYTEKVDGDSLHDRKGLSSSLDERLGKLREAIQDGAWPDEVEQQVARLEERAEKLVSEPEKNPIDRWRNGFRAEADRLDGDLRAMRRGRLSTVG